LIDAVFGEQHRETAAVIGLDRVGEGRQQRCKKVEDDGAVAINYSPKRESAVGWLSDRSLAPSADAF
jgi:hypothetical protein